MTVSEYLLPFKEPVSKPWAVCDCFGILGFRNPVVWTLVDKRVRKWVAFKYCDGAEEYSPSELAVIYKSELLPSAFIFAVPVVAAAVLLMLGPCVLLSLFYLAQSPSIVDRSLSSLLEQFAYSVDAQNRLGPDLGMIHVKPALYQKVVFNPIFPLAGESAIIPKTDRQAQKYHCSPYWNTDKELCLRLGRHRELHAHDDVDCSFSSVQVLDTKWVFDLKINRTTRQIERFKTRIVAHGEPQVLGFDCYDVHAPTIGLPHIWKLCSPLEGTRPDAMLWTQSISILIQSFEFVPIRDLEYVGLLLSDHDLHFFPYDATPPTMLVDSDLAIVMSQGPTHRSSTKHIGFTMALARDYIQRGRAIMEISPTAEQIADI